MILTALHDAFLIVKFLFGLGALGGLLGVGAIFFWFFLRSIAVYLVQHDAENRYAFLRKLFLEV